MTLLTKKLPKSELGTLLEFRGVFSPWCWDQRFFLGSSPGPSVSMTDVACGTNMRKHDETCRNVEASLQERGGETSTEMWLVFWCFQAVLRTRSAHMLWQGHCFCRYVLHRDLVLEIFFEESQKEFVRPGIRLRFRRDLAETWAFDVVRIRELLSFFSASLKGMLMLQRTPGSCALGCCVAKSWPFLRPTLRSDFKLLALLDVSYRTSDWTNEAIQIDWAQPFGERTKTPKAVFLLFAGHAQYI